MKFVFCTLGFAVVHFIALYLLTFAAGVGSQNRLVVIGAKVLGAPLSLIGGSGSGSSENSGPAWFLIILQSLIWGAGLTFFARWALAARSEF